MPAEITGIEEAKQLIRLLNDMKPELKRAVKEASDQTIFDVKMKMPVWTGRARASWGKYDAGMLVRGNLGLHGQGFTQAFIHQLFQSSEADTFYEERDDGLTIEAGTNLEYVDSLNKGHSQQAPAGFLDIAELEAEKALDDAVNKKLDEVINLYGALKGALGG